MATGGNLSYSVLNASDELVEKPCCFCLTRDDNHVHSTHFCVECDGNLCKSCTKWHETFPAMSGHQIMDISMITDKVGHKALLLPTERCEEHHGKLLDTYCPTHGQLCCVLCAILHHRNCEKLQYIPDVSMGIQTSQEYKTVTESVQNVTKQLKRMICSRLSILPEVDEKELKSQMSLQEMDNRLVEHIHDLRIAESTKIKSAYNEFRETVQGELMALDEHLEAIDECGTRLLEKENNDSQVFVEIKKAVKNEKDARNLMTTMTFYVKTPIPQYIVSKNAEKNMCGIISLGKCVWPVKLTLEAKYNVSTASDKSKCDITGMCVLPDGTIILADCNNKCLKQLDHSYSFFSSVDMTSEPWDACYTDTKTKEVAVTLFNEHKVQFISVRSIMKKARAFSIGAECKGICFSNGELFVCCVCNTYEMVRVFTLDGNATRTIQLDKAEQSLSSNYITPNTDGSKLHVTNLGKRIITMDRTGQLLSTYTDPKLNACGICTLSGDDLLVIGYYTHNVVHLSSDGRKLGVVLAKQDGLDHPRAICYNFVNNTVILSTNKSNVIQVYNINM